MFPAGWPVTPAVWMPRGVVQEAASQEGGALACWLRQGAV